MIFLTGFTSDTQFVSRLKSLGFGRMMCERFGNPWENEPWGWDNGAFVAWNKGLFWDGREYLKMTARIADNYGTPYLAIVPDVVADHDSLRFSLAWRERVAQWDWPWYLAVQDGMTPEDVAPHVDCFSGIFLGGTKEWKRRTAKTWCDFAHAHGLPAHYARCSVEADIAAAKRFGYDSADSTFLLWTRDRFEATISLLVDQPMQAELPL